MTTETTKNMQWKIVDTFNGWESHTRHNSKESARAELDADTREFRRRHTWNTTYCKGVVRADAVWQWDHVQGRYTWS